MPTWERFRELCQLHFGPAMQGTRLAELARLPFGSSVQDYSERYNAVLCHERDLNARQKAQLYVGGLPEHIRVDVEMHHPPDLQTAMYYARAYERRTAAFLPALQHLQQQQRGGRGPRPAAAVPATATPTPAVPAPAQPTVPAAPVFRRLTPAEQAERRQEGLCFNCDEPFVRGHVCKRLFYLETTDYIDDEPGELVHPEEPADQEATANSLVVSLHAIAGIRPPNAMLLPVIVKGERFLTLLDTGSTHNFIQGAAMRRLGLTPTRGEHLQVTVANGDRLECEGVAHDVPISIGDDTFVITCVGLNLGAFHFIIGFDFLRTLGPMLWDCEALTLSFWWDGHRVTWQGVSGPPPAALQQALAAVSADPRLPLLDHLLLQHNNIFDEPTGLPPPRPYDHRIHLLPETAPVAVRPYHYPQMQKDELERQCATMLAQGIIRPSTSSFSAPVLLVRKAENSWRFCIDYRALNTKTSKDKFPILVVDELLDELHGARFFTKLDLRSGYHQVRMHPDDTDKTAFRTHHGHFEFLVMPFGLSNAPATFQALMNDVLQPFLRRFVLVFCDDILIYSSSWVEHLQHINIVLNALRAHHLHLKRSKCSFGASLVAYLGHVISKGGVAMDADKTAAVAAWPSPSSAHSLRGFLGLAGYYRKFIRDFGIIAAPLTRLLRRDAFVWDDDAAAAFEALKRALTTGPVLQMPDFTAPFVVDCDASEVGFGVVLHQGAGPLAYFSRPFAARHLKLAYERELIAIGDLTYGDGTSWFVPITTASNFCLTSVCPQFRSTSGSVNFLALISPWSIARAALTLWRTRCLAGTLRLRRQLTRKAWMLPP